MRIAYFDEAGDDGYPEYSSPLFVLTSLYLHYLHWQPTHEALHAFRRDLKANFGIPVKTEMHTRQLLTNKNPFRPLGLSEAQRIQIIDHHCDLIGDLSLRVINVAIVKPRLVRPEFEVLDTALKYLVQRVENDLEPDRNPEERFLLITDPGRVGKMRKTTRRIQRINYIPSKFGGQSYRREIRSLIEDPLPKDSKESFFIQLADLISYVVYLYTLDVTGVGTYPNRIAGWVTPAVVTNWLERMKGSLNLEASRQDPYGVVIHPK